MDVRNEGWRGAGEALTVARVVLVGGEQRAQCAQLLLSARAQVLPRAVSTRCAGRGHSYLPRGC